MPVLAIVVGVIMSFVAYGTNTAPEGTHNLGLLQNQMMTLHSALALFLAGVIRLPRSTDEARIAKEPVYEEGRAERLAAFDRKLYIALGVIVVLVLLISFGLR